MELFRNHIKSEIAGDNPYYFTTQKRNSLIKSVAQGISSHTKSSGLGHMTSNDFRRSATNITRAVDGSKSSEVAIHMNHSLAVAEKIYNIFNKDHASFAAAEFLDDAYIGRLRPTSNIEGN